MEKLDLQAKKILIVIYYLNKMHEFGITKDTPYKITKEKFSFAEELAQSDIEINVIDVVEMLKLLECKDIEVVTTTCDIIMQMQDLGIEGFKVKYSDFIDKKRNDERN